MTNPFEFNPDAWSDDVKAEFASLILAIPPALDWLMEHTKDDKRWDIMVDAYKTLTKQHGAD